MKTFVGIFATLIGLGFVLATCHVANWPHYPGPPSAPAHEPFNGDGTPSRVISSTIYTPFVHHFDVAWCKSLFPPEALGGFCDYNDGVDLPDGCASGYHMERQTLLAAIGSPTSTVVRKVCHLDTARGERGAGLACEK